MKVRPSAYDTPTHQMSALVVDLGHNGRGRHRKTLCRENEELYQVRHRGL